MWPDNETTLDLLNVRHLVGAVTGIVRNKRVLPVTVGVFGDWGSGKSSVAAMVREELNKDPKVLCVWFNGWRFEGYEDAKAALMGTILDEIRDQRNALDKAKDVFLRLVRRVHWLRATKILLPLGAGVISGDPGSVVGGAVAAATLARDTSPEELEKLVRAEPDDVTNIRRTVRNFNKDFQELLERTEVETLVVIIDDLDRCLPDRIINTLEAIRLFLFVPRTAFIIAADEALVQHAVKLRFPEMDELKLNVGRDYLEKLIQMPVRVPPLSRSDVETYLNLLIAQLHLDEEQFKVLCERLATTASQLDDVLFTAATSETFLRRPPSTELAEDLGIAAQIADVLALSVDGNPRQTKRFLNALLLRLQMAKAKGVDLQRRIAAKLLLFEYFRAQTFRELAKWQAEQSGMPKEIRLLESHQADATRQAETSESSKKQSTPRGRTKNEPRAEVDAEAAQAKLPGQLEAWVNDEWIQRWLAIEPPLAGIDLRPYFYFARERFSLHASLSQRLSPAGRAVLELFLSPSDAVRRTAPKRAETLTGADAAGIFSALGDRTRRTEQNEGDSSPLVALIQLVEVRAELWMELISLLRSLPVSSIPASIAVRLVQAASNPGAVSATQGLFDEWSVQDMNPMLAAAARSQRPRLSEGQGSTPRARPPERD